MVTSLELTHKTVRRPTKPKDPITVPEPEVVPVLIPTPSPDPTIVPSPEPDSEGFNWVAFGLALGASVVAGFAIVETVATFGAGAWNDVPAISYAAASWANVFAN